MDEVHDGDAAGIHSEAGRGYGPMQHVDFYRIEPQTFFRPYIFLFRSQKSGIGKSLCFANTYNAYFTLKNVFLLHIL
jgi:hypothetical protein